MLQVSVTITPGYINDRKAKILRGTAATIIIVRKEYLNIEDYGGNKLVVARMRQIVNDKILLGSIYTRHL